MELFIIGFSIGWGFGFILGSIIINHIANRKIRRMAVRVRNSMPDMITEHNSYHGIDSENVAERANEEVER